eukprot:TRINITY_DN25425_c0_g1_i1.p1 TRINITY_DN25425_c0_g1~~TRINITY_DN25425_c0_g1_i1.p1  ORF type:complete len:150 (+),score=18.87 TRINITY_DN25425_c0_g1_i1:64-513(+)
MCIRDRYMGSTFGRGDDEEREDERVHDENVDSRAYDEDLSSEASLNISELDDLKKQLTLLERKLDKTKSNWVHQMNIKHLSTQQSRTFCLFCKTNKILRQCSLYHYCFDYILHFSLSLCSTSFGIFRICLLYTSPSPRDGLLSRMPSSA